MKWLPSISWLLPSSRGSNPYRTFTRQGLSIDPHRWWWEVSVLRLLGFQPLPPSCVPLHYTLFLFPSFMYFCLGCYVVLKVLITQREETICSFLETITHAGVGLLSHPLSRAP